MSGPPPPPPLRNLSKSVPSLLGDGTNIGDADLDCPPAVPSRSRRHSTKGTVVEEKVKQFAEKEFIKVSKIIRSPINLSEVITQFRS